MTNDEQSIRDLVAEWQSATAAGDLTRILPLMAEDVVFLIAGSPPMRGREAFATAFKMGVQHIRIESSVTIQEIQIAGDFAYGLSHLNVVVTPLWSADAPLRLHADDFSQGGGRSLGSLPRRQSVDP